MGEWGGGFQIPLVSLSFFRCGFLGLKWLDSIRGVATVLCALAFRSYEESGQEVLHIFHGHTTSCLLTPCNVGHQTEETFHHALASCRVGVAT